MKNQFTEGPWYAENAGNDYQAIIASETTGETIAVTYDRKNMNVLAASLDLLEACQFAFSFISEHQGWWFNQGENDDTEHAIFDALESAIRKATE